MPAPQRMTIRQQEAHAKKQIAAWNAKYPVGTLVSFEEVIGRGETHRSKARSEATMMSCQAVIWIEAQGSCVSLDHCTVVAGPADEIQLVDQALKAYQVGDYDIVAAYTPEGAITVLCEQNGWPREDYALDEVQLVGDKHLDSLEVFDQDEGKTEKLKTSLRQDVAALNAPAYMYGWE